MKKLILGSIIAAVLFPNGGCGMITTRTVAITAGKAVYEKLKDEKEKKEAEKPKRDEG